MGLVMAMVRDVIKGTGEEEGRGGEEGGGRGREREIHR